MKNFFEIRLFFANGNVNHDESTSIKLSTSKLVRIGSQSFRVWYSIQHVKKLFLILTTVNPRYSTMQGSDHGYTNVFYRLISK